MRKPVKFKDRVKAGFYITVSKPFGYDSEVYIIPAIVLKNYMGMVRLNIAWLVFGFYIAYWRWGFE